MPDWPARVPEEPTPETRYRRNPRSRLGPDGWRAYLRYLNSLDKGLPLHDMLEGTPIVSFGAILALNDYEKRKRAEEYAEWIAGLGVVEDPEEGWCE